MLTRPRYAAQLGKEAAKHASSQPFLVSLERNGQKVLGAVAPLGEYAPVTPAYSNPLAQFIPNVTYYPAGNNPMSSTGGRRAEIFNPFDDDNTTSGFFPLRKNTLKGTDSAHVAGYLSHLYSALATDQSMLKRETAQESRIQSAIARVERIARAQSSVGVAEPEESYDYAVEPQPLARRGAEYFEPSLRTPLGYRRPFNQYEGAYEGGDEEVLMPGQQAARSMVTISPRGPQQGAEDQLPEFA